MLTSRHHVVCLDSREQLAVAHPQRQERTEIAFGAGFDLTFPLREHIAMVVNQDRIAEFYGEAVPDALVVGDAQLALLPDFGPFAAVFVGGLAHRLDAELEGAGAMQLDLLLEFEGAGALLEIVAVVQSAVGGKLRAVEIVAQYD